MNSVAVPANTPAESLLAEAMAGYREDPLRGDFLIRCACAQAADPLPLLRTAYKFYNRQRRFDLAQDCAARALQEAARQAGLPTGFETWTREHLLRMDATLASQALLALKALAFIALRGGDEAAARPYLDRLVQLDPEDGSGASVVAALMESVAEPVGLAALRQAAAIHPGSENRPTAEFKLSSKEERPC